MPFAFVLDDAKEDDDDDEEERNAREEHVEDIIASRDAIIVGSSRARRAAFLFLPLLSLGVCFLTCACGSKALGVPEADLLKP